MANQGGHTKYKKGQSGNPNGRPKGTKNMTTKVREALEAVSENGATTEQEELVSKVIEMAKEGDQQMIKLIWNYLDGMPVQKQEISGEDGGPVQIEGVTVKIVDGNSDEETT